MELYTVNKKRNERKNENELLIIGVETAESELRKGFYERVSERLRWWSATVNLEKRWMRQGTACEIGVCKEVARRPRTSRSRNRNYATNHGREANAHVTRHELNEVRDTSWEFSYESREKKVEVGDTEFEIRDEQ